MHKKLIKLPVATACHLEVLVFLISRKAWDKVSYFKTFMFPERQQS